MAKCDQMKAEILKNTVLDVQREAKKFEDSKQKWEQEKKALETEIEELKRLIKIGKVKSEISTLGDRDKTSKKIGFESTEEVERRT